MAQDDLLPPACAFAISVLAERDADPDSVPEEAVEAAQQHMASCARCLSAPLISPGASTLQRKKKKVRRAAGLDTPFETSIRTSHDEPAFPLPSQFEPTPLLDIRTESAALAIAPDDFPQTTQGTRVTGTQQELGTRAPVGMQQEETRPPTVHTAPAPTGTEMDDRSVTDGVDRPLDCLECRQLLRDYAEAMEDGQNAEALYPEVQEHLFSCEAGCLVLLDLFRQEAKANRKNRRRPVRNPFSVMVWEVTGFFRGGLVPIAPRALAYGSLILLLLAAGFGVYLGVRWDDARYYHPAPTSIPTPDGIGLSDGLNIYDACNANSYAKKREAALTMQQGNFSKADGLLASATSAVSTDTTGCNGAEAAIYREDLHVRQSGRPFGMVVVSFDSGPGNADPRGGTDRHILYAAYTQELVGAFIAQQSYNAAQMQTAGAPLLYLVLANTAGVEQGALQVANSIATLTNNPDLQQFGLLARGNAPLLAVLGLGPSSLVQVVLPVLCRAGVPLIAPTATGLFIIDLLSQTSLYRHCKQGFAFVRFSPDDAHQSQWGADYAYTSLNARNAAIFYDPSNPSSAGSAQSFIASFSTHTGTRIVAQETAVASGLLDANGRPQASRADLLAAFNDALHAQPRPDLMYAPLLTNDVITLAQAIARLPQRQQPILVIGGEFVQPAALQELVQWARQQQLALPRIFVTLSSAVRPPGDGDWQKQFYASFCTSFATPGSFCSGAAALDQGALLFADGVEVVAKGVGSITTASQFPTTAQLVQRISQEKLAGVSCPISLHLWDNVLVTSTRVLPVILGIQQDGSISIVG